MRIIYDKNISKKNVHVRKNIEHADANEKVE